MTIREMYEIIKEQRPDISLNQAVILMNQVMDDFVSRTNISKGTYTFNSTDDIYYDIDNFIQVDRVVVVDGDVSIEASRLIEYPLKETL